MLSQPSLSQPSQFLTWILGHTVHTVGRAALMRGAAESVRASSFSTQCADIRSTGGKGGSFVSTVWRAES